MPYFSLGQKYGNWSQELVGDSNNELQQYEVEYIVRNREIEFADDHAGGVSGYEDYGQ